MAVTVERLTEAIGTSDENYDEVQGTLTLASTLVSNYVGYSDVPEVIVDMAIIKVGVAIWQSNHFRMAIAEGFYENQQTPALPNRDVMMPAYILLRGWVSPW